MTKTLVLVRHAEAEYAAPSDFERSLTTKGQECATRLGQELVLRSRCFELAVVSTATRAQETFTHLAVPLHITDVDHSADLYDATVFDLLDMVSDFPENVSTALVVGHEPTISSAGTALLALKEDNEHTMFGVPTGTAIVLRLPHGWTGGAELVEIIRSH